MNEKQMTGLARALMQECSAQTLGMLGDALTAAQTDGATGAGLRVIVDTAREMRQETEQQAAQRPAQTLGEALTRDRAAGRR